MISRVGRHFLPQPTLIYSSQICRRRVPATPSLDQGCERVRDRNCAAELLLIRKVAVAL